MTTQSQKMADFSRIDISGGYHVILRQDSSYTVSLTADDNLMKNIIIKVDDGRLKVYNRKSICNSGEMKLVIGVGNLDKIKATGAVELESQGKLNVHDLTMNYSGATKIMMDLNAGNVETEGSGSIEIHLKGQATSHRVNLSGSGELYAYDFVTGTYNITTSGASDCEINVLKALNVHTSGASDIKYKGNPAEVTNHKSGASSITKVN